MRSKDNRGIKKDMESEEFLLIFDSEDPEFSRGFACGEIWACLTDDVDAIRAIITSDCTEMVMRMAEATDYTFEARDLTSEELALLHQDKSDEWLIVTMKAKND
jgi:hypothetical protein